MRSLITVRCLTVSMLLFASPVSVASQNVSVPAPDELEAVVDDSLQIESQPVIDCAPSPYVVFFGHRDSNPDPFGQTILASVVERLRTCPFAEIVLSGHADSAGAAEANLVMSQQRAESVRDILVRSGIDREALTLEAFGESRPLVDTADGVREPQNRRVEISVRQGAPVFQLPAPQPSAHLEIPRGALGAGLSTLGDVNQRLRARLGRARYREPTYLAVRNGFAMIVRMERREDDADPWPDQNVRWDIGPASLLPANAGIVSRFMAAWSGGPPHAGRYRLYVLLVTTEDVRASAPPPTAEQTLAWIGQGWLRLPQTIADAPYTGGHQVIVLIYDFLRPTVSSRMQLLRPSPHAGSVHLQRSQIASVP